MIVISLTNCPISLRGDLTKWLVEINTGVFVGKVSARVRDNLWERIKDNLKDGQATLVYNVNNEQHMNFRVHNTENEIIDFDGLKLVLKPSRARVKKLARLRMGFSKAAKWRRAKNIQAAAKKEVKNKDEKFPNNYVVLDIETSGLSVEKNEIIEIGMLKVRDGSIAEIYQHLVRPQKKISVMIEGLTGISNEMLVQDGREINSLLMEIREFIGEDMIIGHNVQFDIKFLNHALEMNGMPHLTSCLLDTMKLYAGKTNKGKKKLAEIVEEYGVEDKPCHRAINDCKAVKAIYDVMRANLADGKEGELKTK